MIINVIMMIIMIIIVSMVTTITIHHIHGMSTTETAKVTSPCPCATRVPSCHASSPEKKTSKINIYKHLR